MNSKKVLVVEDESIVALELGETLVANGYLVTGITGSAAGALESARNEAPDLVLMDIKLGPGPDGIETARQIKEISNAQILYLSAYSDNQLLQNALDTNPSGFLTKPYKTADLLLAIKIALKNNRSIQRASARETPLDQVLNELDALCMVIDQDGVEKFRSAGFKKTFGPTGAPVGLDDIISDWTGARGVSGKAAFFEEIKRLERINFKVKLYDKNNRQLSLICSAVIVEENGPPEIMLMMIPPASDCQLQTDYFCRDVSRSVSRFAIGLSRDINNQLAGVVGSIELARIQKGESSTELNIERATAYLKSILDLSEKLFMFEQPLEEREVFSVTKLLHRLVQWSLSNSRAKVELIRRTNLDHFILGNEENFFKALTYIIRASENSKASDCEIKIVLNSEVRKDPLGYHSGQNRIIKLIITDNGPRISMPNPPGFFQPYSEVDPRSSGIEISSVYSIINRHHGEIMVEPAGSNGARYIIQLPEDSAKAVEKGSSKQLGSTDKNRSKKILLMDDDKSVRDSMLALLENYGFDIWSAKTGGEAVDLFYTAYQTSRPFEIIILDYHIANGMNGDLALKQIRKIDQSTPAIIASGMHHEPAVENFAEYGFNAALNKPYGIRDLLSLLDKFDQIGERLS